MSGGESERLLGLMGEAGAGGGTVADRFGGIVVVVYDQVFKCKPTVNGAIGIGNDKRALKIVRGKVPELGNVVGDVQSTQGGEGRLSA